MLPETILTHDGAQGFLAGPKPPIPPPQPGSPFPVPPWPGPRTRPPSGCACGLPRSEYEGHWCPAREWKWTRWPS